MRVAIVGVGLIGGSLGMALRERRLAETVVGVGRNADSLQKAVHLGAIDSFSTDFADGVQNADLVVLATPIGQILADIEKLPGLLSPGAIVTDVGSTKGEISEWGDRFLRGAFVPGHPMAGGERSGVEAARANLFDEATWAITPTRHTNPDAANTVRHLAQAVGAQVITLSPQAHDEAVAATSHLPHVLAYALASVAGAQSGSNPHVVDLAAGSFASGTRVAQSSPDLWREIALSNRAALAHAVRTCQAELSEVIVALDSGDGDAIQAAFMRGHRARQQFPA